MATFSPAGIIRIGRVPFDNSYQHTIAFATAADQQAYMTSVCERSFDRDTYTYVRQNNVIRVGINAEQLYTYNYVMFQNANYGTKWFYSFITNVEYINENMTELTLELDVMQTYWFDYTFSECMVEREHVDNDRIGLHTNPEPEMPFNVITHLEKRYEPYENGSYAVAMVTAHSTDGENLDPVQGTMMNGVFSGAHVWAELYMSPNFPAELSQELSFLRKAGGSDAVANIFVYPAKFMNGLTPSQYNPRLYTVNSTRGGISDLIQIGRPSSLGRYTPKNNKLLCYPYSFCRIETSTGESADLKWELWEPNDDGLQVLNVSCALSPDAMCILQPQKYDGSASIWDPSHAVAMKVALNASWINNAYQTWAAQSGMSNALSIAASAAMVAFPAARGIGAASKLLGAGRAARAAHAGTKYGEVLKGAHYRTAARKGVEAATSPAALTAAGAGVLGLGNVAASYDRMSHTPNVMKGQVDGNTLFSQNQLYFRVRAMGMSAEYARIADEFLSMYGYQIDRVKKPNIWSRPAWNYIKTANSCHHGNVPADDMALLNSIWDAGITVWHSTDVGNYSLDNSIGGTGQ